MLKQECTKQLSTGSICLKKSFISIRKTYQLIQMVRSNIKYNTHQSKHCRLAFTITNMPESYLFKPTVQDCMSLLIRSWKAIGTHNMSMNKHELHLHV